jgi:hypothetical protein
MLIAAPDDDLSGLTPQDLARVCCWAEDRFINAVAALDYRLGLEPPGMLACDATLQVARHAVAQVLAGVEEVRAMARGQRPEGGGQR